MESKSLIFRRAAQEFLSDVYTKQYTSEKIASMTPEEQTPHTPQIGDAVYTKPYIRSKSASMIRGLQTPSPHSSLDYNSGTDACVLLSSGTGASLAIEIGSPLITA